MYSLICISLAFAVFTLITRCPMCNLRLLLYMEYIFIGPISFFVHDEAERKM